MKSINRPLTVRGPRQALDAETLAAEALGFIAEDGERLQRFMATTGFDPAGLREAAGRRGFARSMLAYLGSDEELLTAFAATRGLDPMAVGQLVQRVVDGPRGPEA